MATDAMLYTPIESPEGFQFNGPGMVTIRPGIGSSQLQANAIAYLLGRAFRAGRADAQREIREALGVK